MKHYLLLPLLTAGLAVTLPAVTIISLSDSTPGTNPGSFTVASNRALAVSWTQTATFTNVTIQAAVGFGTNIGGSSINSAFLTTSLGAGTTQGANQVAANTNFTANNLVPNTPAPLFTLFSGLTLGPGTYYLSLFYSSGGTITWDAEPPATLVTDPSASLDSNFFLAATSFAGYLPASTFSLQTFGPGFFAVTGDPTGTPEPSTFVMLGLGLAGVAFLRRK